MLCGCACVFMCLGEGVGACVCLCVSAVLGEVLRGDEDFLNFQELEPRGINK